jgi:hypothetical protein
MDITTPVGLAIAGYAGFAFLGAAVSVMIRRGGLADVMQEEPDAGAMLATYSAGFRGGIWITAAILYAMAAALVFGRVGDAVYVYAAALLLDCGLFLSWVDRRRYTAMLTPLQRFGEIATVLFVGGTLVLLWLMRQGGALQ